MTTDHQAKFQSDYLKLRSLLVAGKLSRTSAKDWLQFRNSYLVSQMVLERLKPFGRRVERELEGLEEETED